MIYFPPLRRLLLPSLVFLTLLVIYRSSHKFSSSYLSSFVIEQPIIANPGQRIPVKDLDTRALVIQDPATGKHVTPPIPLFYDYGRGDGSDPGEFDPTNETEYGPRYIDPGHNRYLNPLLECRIKPNKFTQHIRLPNVIRPISMVVTGESENEKRNNLNAAILSLPYWSENQYLLVTRVQTDGSLQLNLICEANICYTGGPENGRPGELPCDEEALKLLDGQEGMRCATPPMTLNVPPTPAKNCGNGTGILMDVPGFHDPRIFWSGKGEPIMMMNTQSRYACFGLWVIDLRTLHFPLEHLLGSNPRLPTLGPLMSYPSLTEITRNPPESRGVIEKNWMFFANHESTFIHYDIGPKVRSFAKLLGGGLTTPNLTDPLEQPCLVTDGATPGKEDRGGSWHQGTNSLRLILCERSDGACKHKPENTVFFSLIHHKHKNYYDLPLRYERYFIVWSSTPPFSMLAMSSFPILLANETAGGWDAEENWDDDEENKQMLAEGKEGKGDFAIFTYTVSIAYAWGRFEDQPQDKNTGYLDDEVIVGLGIDDEQQAFARVKVQDLLQCLRVCPGRADSPLDGRDKPGSVSEVKHSEKISPSKFDEDQPEEEELSEEDKRKEQDQEDEKKEEKDKDDEKKEEKDKEDGKKDDERKDDKDKDEKEKGKNEKSENDKSEDEKGENEKDDQKEEEKEKIDKEDEEKKKKEQKEREAKEKGETERKKEKEREQAETDELRRIANALSVKSQKAKDTNEAEKKAAEVEDKRTPQDKALEFKEGAT